MVGRFGAPPFSFAFHSWLDKRTDKRVKSAGNALQHMVRKWVNLRVLRSRQFRGNPLDFADFPRRRSGSVRDNASNEMIDVVFAVPREGQLRSRKRSVGFLSELSKPSLERVFSRIEESSGKTPRASVA
jgi:hypothetical protein